MAPESSSTPEIPADRPHGGDGHPMPWSEHCLQRLDAARGTLRLAGGGDDLSGAPRIALDERSGRRDAPLRRAA